MSVLIDGLKMPKRMPIKALIFPDGRVLITLHSGKRLDCTAVPVAKEIEEIVYVFSKGEKYNA